MAPNNLVPISFATRNALNDLSTRTGRSASDLIAAAVEEYQLRHGEHPVGPVTVIPGVSPTDVWAAAAEADAGQLTAHAEVFAQLRRRA